MPDDLAALITRAEKLRAVHSIVPELVAALKAAQADNVPTRRQYVPAYRAGNGNVIGIGEITGWREGAEQDAEQMRSPDDQTEVFVAYRDLPEWRRVDAQQETND